MRALVQLSALSGLLFACADGPAGETDGQDTSVPRESGDTDLADQDTDDTDVEDTDTDSDTDTDTDTDTDPVLVEVLVAQGHYGRLATSCDGGLSWPVDVDDAPEGGRCWDRDADNYDCDHGEGAGKGVGFGDGVFIANFGWGAPGHLRRSEDGVTWETVHEGQTYSGVSYGNDVWLTGGITPLRSTDGGWTWAPGTRLDVGGHVRRSGFVEAAGGLFVLVVDASGGGTTVRMSADGLDWTGPGSGWESSCGQGIQVGGGVEAVGGALVVAGTKGSVCASSDGGRTFTATSLAVDSSLVSLDGVLHAWGGGSHHTTTDGVSWSSTPIEANGLRPGVVGAVEGGFSMVQGGWQQWYDEQRFWHSTDGVAWTALSSEDAHGGHPMRAMTRGWVPAASACLQDER